MQKELSKTYSPAEVEGRIYEKWLNGGYFKADASSPKPPFTIVMPPPNVTGQLHLGHAMDCTLQDTLIRFKRMNGFEALWLPGTDHAGIATQAKVEEMLRKTEGVSRYDLGREKFLERVWEWKNKYGDTIVNQQKKMGVSADWDRARFTMDEGCSAAVKETFVSLYDKGLIYRGYRITNWCPDCITALSDIEVDYNEKDGMLWYIKYPIKGEYGFITVATTRPETMLGDTGIAVSPEDERYAHLVGKTVILPLMNREIPIFADDYVEKEFGTGCVKTTPCHDPNDFEMGQRHGLEQILVIDDKGKINENGGKYNGLDRIAARAAVLEDLAALGLLVKEEKIVHNVGSCSRCGTVVEPLASKQWFVNMKPLAEKAIAAVVDGDIEFTPDRFLKIYLNWMENVRDWCISRQLWWGHRIPAYTCEDCGEMVVSKTDVTVCPKCSSSKITQESDVLDTWFSSGLWPFSTLGWPEQTKEMEKFYPTSVLVTGYDIIFFWVARMIFSGLEQTGKKPFDDVLIHGLIRDKFGKKMSKSAGNGIDPLEVVEQYGADALRFTLATGCSPGNDMRFSEEKVESSRNFANKLWNASRFVLMNIGEGKTTLPEKLELEDKWILTRLTRVAGEVNDSMNKFDIGVAVTKLYDFIWDDFCDWYIELVKPRLFESNQNEATRASAQQVLLYTLTNILKLLHPVMPFITEEIYQTLPHEDESIMISAYPRFDEKLNFTEEEAQMVLIMEVIKAVRNRRGEMNIPPSQKAHIYIETQLVDIFKAGTAFFQRLAGASAVSVDTVFDVKNAVQIITDGAKTLIPLSELIDKEKELKRLDKEKASLEAEIKRVESKLANPGFLAKAPDSLVEEERAKGDKFRQMLILVETSITETMNL